MQCSVRGTVQDVRSRLITVRLGVGNSVLDTPEGASGNHGLVVRVNWAKTEDV
ncbi:hypothetical protein ACFWNT_32720 [Streptomyces sp. NPDC058409]|uniref:hypothetical protein n=1 Tax=Streptomyces sp. NPDC058409 TaxID=3346484 RepID=UPI00364A55C5